MATHVWARGDKAPLSRQPSRKNSPRAPARRRRRLLPVHCWKIGYLLATSLETPDAPLGELEEQELCRKWLPLCNETGQRTGKIEIALRWLHNPKKHVDVPTSSTLRNEAPMR